VKKNVAKSAEKEERGQFELFLERLNRRNEGKVITNT
jgi:hypothetical protein